MAYLVSLTSRAEHDLAFLYDEIDAECSDAARKWYGELKAAILDLEKRPYSWPETHESRRFRHLLFGRRLRGIYRVVYRVRERQKLVEILHIRHGSRRPFHPSEIK